MSDETSKAHERRVREDFYQKYCVGRGIDIGCGGDLLHGCDRWDQEHGDATFMSGVPDDSYDFVHSSHCLEHLQEPLTAVRNWWRILRPGGYLIVGVPDEDLYEQGIWPSRFNPDHKTTWTISKESSWSSSSQSVVRLLDHLPKHKVVSIRIIDTGYDYSLKNVDQSLGRAEVTLEFIIQKMS